MADTLCLVCGKALDGWVYDFKTHYSTVGSSNFAAEWVIGYRCASCGASVCANIHNKELRASPLSGLNKIACPKCGGAFGPPQVITLREISRIPAMARPASVVHPWAAQFLDVRTGERALAADQPVVRGEGDFRLLLTDRRLVILPPSLRAGASQSVFVNADLHCTVIPLRQIASVDVSRTPGGGTSLTVCTADGEPHTFKSKVPFDNFGESLRQAIVGAPSALLFPPGEQVLFDGGANFDILSVRDFLAKKAPVIHARQFSGSFRISVAVTDRRLLFYRINHIASIQGIGVATVQLGPPSLQFISLAWEAVPRVIVNRSYAAKSATLMVRSPLRAWAIDSLRVPPADDPRLSDALEGTEHTPVPILGAQDQEWELPLTGNLQAWDAFLRPAMHRARPQLAIEDPGTRK